MRIRLSFLHALSMVVGMGIYAFMSIFMEESGESFDWRNYILEGIAFIGFSVQLVYTMVWMKRVLWTTYEQTDSLDNDLLVGIQDERVVSNHPLFIIGIFIASLFTLFGMFIAVRRMDFILFTWDLTPIRMAVKLMLISNLGLGLFTVLTNIRTWSVQKVVPAAKD